MQCSHVFSFLNSSRSIMKENANICLIGNYTCSVRNNYLLWPFCQSLSSQNIM
uniref:Uncharacterized protein n=1 Tax=Arundo donax TaxID=35708 RepID=A0A0A9EKF7_ARUDO